jgi:hypothetical protein
MSRSTPARRGQVWWAWSGVVTATVPIALAAGWLGPGTAAASGAAFLFALLDGFRVTVKFHCDSDADNHDGRRGPRRLRLAEEQAESIPRKLIVSRHDGPVADVLQRATAAREDEGGGGVDSEEEETSTRRRRRLRAD